MQIFDLPSLKQFFHEYVKTPIFGVGVYAFDRLGLEDIVPDYRLLALRYSRDTKLIEQDMEVFALEKDMGTKHINAPRNSTTVLAHHRVKEYLYGFQNPALVIYKSSTKIERICRENGWLLVASPVKFGKALLEDKVKFRRILEKIGVPPPPGEILGVKDLDFYKLTKRYGAPFVLQHPRRGGGKGTFFINTEDQWNQAIKKLRVHGEEGEETHEDISDLELIAAQYVQGPSPSITGCVTRHGILSTNLQYQLIDIPELYNPAKGSGLFCGHDWSAARFTKLLDQQAYNIVTKIGTYFKTLGYKGIFGIDFVLDKNTQKLYVTECNPRLLGSFPVLAMAQAQNGEPPILAFHLLEYLGIDYEIDINQINALMRQPKEGAQMFLHNLTGQWTRNNGTVIAGVYRLRRPPTTSRQQSITGPGRSSSVAARRLKFVRPGYALRHLAHKDEFLLADGVLQKKSHYSPNRRLCRIVTLRRVLAKDKKTLTPWAKTVAQTVHDAFRLKKVRFVRLFKIFNPNFLAKG